MGTYEGSSRIENLLETWILRRDFQVSQPQPPMGFINILILNLMLRFTICEMKLIHSFISCSVQ